jgi:hypothetical protein
MARIKLALAVVALALLGSGCATVTKGTNQAVTIHTDPDGATCDVSRELKTVASIAATPGQVTVDKAFGAIDVSCRKTGHQSTELRVDSQVQGWTFGNILLGGLIGFAVDAASGAMREYPQFITLTLVPDEFASAEERERYVDERLARFDTEAVKASALLDKDCGADPCVEQRKALEETKSRRVALLRERVDKARIRAPVEALAR